MNIFVLATPIVAMACLLVLMQAVETRLTPKAPTDQPRPPAGTRAEARHARSEATSPLLAAAPVVLAIVTAVLVAAVVVRMAS